MPILGVPDPFWAMNAVVIPATPQFHFKTIFLKLLHEKSGRLDLLVPQLGLAVDVFADQYDVICMIIDQSSCGCLVIHVAPKFVK
ncbi:hypothetical protein DRO27_04300 [Candidatus Bathyarchaeota archaeon]|nr:MAG: hypothetical protein DRO27_04300 [Candidatus Bathyarchaeota archaeon]